jgi:putative transposase
VGFAKLKAMKLHKTAAHVEERVDATRSYMACPEEHWRRIRTDNLLERIMKEIRRRTRVVGSFPDGKSALMLVSARLRHITGTKWGTQALSVHGAALRTRPHEGGGLKPPIRPTSAVPR